MSASLPPGLWELTMSRICPRPSNIRMGRLGFAHAARQNAQAAVAKSSFPSASYPPFSAIPTKQENDGSRPTIKRPGPLTPRSARPTTGSVAEIERRVHALKEAADVEVLASEQLIFSEEALLTMYEDLLTHSEEIPDATSPVLQVEEDMGIVRQIEQQLLHDLDERSPAENSPLVTKLRSGQPLPAVDTPIVDETMELHRRVLQLANARLDRLSVLQPSASVPLVPIVLFSMNEYEALTRVCVNSDDLDAAESVLQLMKRSSLAIPEESLTTVLRQYSAVGDVEGVERCLAAFLIEKPTPVQSHLHVKAHLRATPRDRVPESALAVLHSYEVQGHPAPMKTYTSAIAFLYSTRLSVARAQAWDLFSHMRYVAHPKPDVVLYTSMIRACASPISTSRSSDPERALDLWTEMTVEQGLTPTVGSYNAVILACAKSGLKEYVNEAFRIAKQMLDSNRDAYGRSAYLPDRRTLCALLEGAKRIGDLARARWILADLVKDKASEEESVNEEIMMHVFHTYTSYVPPFTRNLAVVVPGREQKESLDSESASDIIESSQSATHTHPPAGHLPRFTRIPPQTSHEVIEEVQALFQRVLEDTGKGSESALDNIFAGAERFQHVKLTTRLLNSYLSVHYQHSSLEASEALFWKIFDDVGITPDARSYLEALERCSRSKRGHERPIGLQFAEKLWAKWLVVEDAGRACGRPVDARMVERAHVAFMRVIVLNGQLQRALEHVKAFAERYPPSHLYDSRLKPGFRSTRTVLVGPRPLVRLSSPNEVPDDSVPPLLMFSDLELLHHRLVGASMKSGIGYIKYISKAYEWALRGRRDAAMKASPPRERQRDRNDDLAGFIARAHDIIGYSALHVIIIHS
ncbi:hypothetical protein MSAN_00566100 [Mycena sanguinolenta]|uniref:Uncharacterized protein n=1 Tax=Mycena sanguinolenta TaxID=230812 RepID=A0A8H7DHP0_9AGAR|nr:hypothetical protein MSAN_00566100 [Mycena sanguinolenta]